MKRPETEGAFDLAQLRKLKRLTKRVYRGLEEMERHILKMAKPRNGKATAAEIELTTEMYRKAAQVADAMR